jgi:hypothetical protein
MVTYLQNYDINSKHSSQKVHINDMANVFYRDKWAFFPFKHICLGNVMIQKDKCQY